MEDPLPANTSVEVFIEWFHLSMVWWPPTGSVHRLSKLKKKKKNRSGLVGDFCFKKKIMLSLKVHTRPILGQAFPLLIEEMQICCSATEQNNLEIASLITKRHDLEANTTDLSGFLKPELQWPTCPQRGTVSIEPNRAEGHGPNKALRCASSL